MAGNDQQLLNAIESVGRKVDTIGADVGELKTQVTVLTHDWENCKERCVTHRTMAGKHRDENTKKSADNLSKIGLLEISATRALGWWDLTKIIVPLLGALVALKRLGLI